MNIQAEKLHLVKMILETENPKVLESVKKLLSGGKNTDFWNSLTINQKREIESGIAEIETGLAVDYESIMSKHRK